MSYYSETASDVLGERIGIFEKASDKVPDMLKDAVKKLEDKGYIVNFSSPGYVDGKFKNDQNKDTVINGKHRSTGRVVFKKKYIFEDAPVGWEIKYFAKCVGIYVIPKTFDYDGDLSPEESFEKWQGKYLYELDKWVDDLKADGTGDTKEEK